jgi:hypothetical protein
MRVLDSWVAYADVAYYLVAPGLCRTAEGDLLLGFRRQPNRRLQQRDNLHIDTDSHVALLRSNDEGRSWSQPQVIHHHEDGLTGEQAAELTTLDNGRVMIGSFRWRHQPGRSEDDLGGPHVFTRGYHKWAKNNPWEGAFQMIGGMVAHSDDGGRTFSPWRQLPALPDRFVGGVAAVQGKIVQLPGGRLLLPAYAGKLRRSGAHVQSNYAAVCFASDDGGVSWRFLSTVAENRDPRGQGFDEHSLCLTAAGEVVSFLRATWDPQDCLWMARSRDGGDTWTFRRLNTIIGHPCKALRLRDGRLFMVYGHRHFPSPGVRARILDPQASDPEAASEAIIRDEGAPQGMRPDEAVMMDLGYPDAVELDDRRVLVVSYRRDSAGDAQAVATLVQL